MEHIARDEAFALLKKYNKDPFHIQHALTVEAVMKWYAKELGYGDDAEYWGIVGLLHDIDFELYPEEHCLKAPELSVRQVWEKISFMRWFLMDMELLLAVELPLRLRRSMRWKKSFLQRMSSPV